eukprot:TRINITY_DN17893_c0_g1_i1.p1 TRINITY_DN17893_c0_g1~~TRINITY_DN17893_c0_g1_i1.p1  ORF type:complete len:349 (+),score=26.71 TRINITY_DN17893_c0_g1_i1:36-1049(+)
MIQAPLLDSDAQADAVCRFCHGCELDRETDPLLSPCICRGTLRWVHHACLSQWRSQFVWPDVKACQCELCGFIYLYELQTRSPLDVLAVLLRKLLRKRSTAALAVFLSSDIVALTHTAHTTLEFGGGYLGLWALIDFSGAVLCAARCLLLRRGLTGSAVLTDQTFASVAWHCLLFALRKGRPSAEAIAQARGIRESEAATQRLAEERAMSRREEFAEPTTTGSSEDREFSGNDRVGAAVILAGCCCGCFLIVFSFLLVVAATEGLVHLAGFLLPTPAAIITFGVGGAMYFATMLLVIVVCTLCRPLPVVLRDAAGVPVVRSLSEYERDHARGFATDF